MSVDRRAWCLTLLAGLIPAAHADEVKAPAKTATAERATATVATAPVKAGQSAPVQGTATKAATVPEAEDELLEFLGSVDSTTGDEDWLEYLSQADIAKAAKARKTEPAAPEVKKND